MKLASAMFSLVLLLACSEPKGGITLTYELEGYGSRRVSKASVEKTIEVLRDRMGRGVRVERDGVGEGSAARVRLEIPWSRFEGSGSLASDLDYAGGALRLKRGASNDFAGTGGLICIEGELLRYGARDGDLLAELERGVNGTPASPHAAGASVHLVNVDEMRSRIEAIGELRFMLRAGDADFEALGTDELTEYGLLDQWLHDHPDAVRLTDFHETAGQPGGPVAGILWTVTRGSGAFRERRFEPLVEPDRPEWRFDQDDLDTLMRSQDALGYPAVRFELKKGRRDAFGDMTEAHIDDQMAVVVDDEIVVLATIRSRLPGGGIIEGGRDKYDESDVAEMVSVLRSGALPLRPRLLETGIYVP